MPTTSTRSPISRFRRMAERTRVDTLKAAAVLLVLIMLMAGGFLVFDLIREGSRPHAPLASALPLGAEMTVLAASQDPGNDGIGIFRDIAVAGRVSESVRMLAQHEVDQLILAGWKVKPTTRYSSAAQKFIDARTGTIDSITIANDRRANIYVAFQPVATVHQYQFAADGSGIYGVKAVLRALRDHQPVLYVTLGNGLYN